MREPFPYQFAFISDRTATHRSGSSNPGTGPSEIRPRRESWVRVACLAAALLTALSLAVHVQAQISAGVCDRTEPVRDAIVDAVADATGCEEVTDDHLARVTALNLFAAGVTGLKAGDFAGMSALTSLNLAYNRLTTLPEGVFEGLTGLETLWLQDNRLLELPGGVFEGLPALADLRLENNLGYPFGPVAYAGPNQTHYVDTEVTLYGTGGDDPWGRAVSYAWAQTDRSGAVVELEGTDTATPTFVAPALESDTLLEFTLTVTAVNPGGVAPPGTTVEGDSAQDVAYISVLEAEAVSVSFFTSSYTATEGGSAAIVAIRLNKIPRRTVTIPLTATPEGGADAGDAVVPENVTFRFAEQLKFITVVANDDAEDDDGESVVIGFGSLPTAVTAGSPSAATVTLVDNDLPPGISIVDVAIASSPGSDATYGVGDTIRATVTFEDAVTVTGTPRLNLEVGTPVAVFLGTAARHADYESGSGSSGLVFAYTVATGDNDPDGVSVAADSLALNNGTISDGEGEAVNVFHQALEPQSGHRVDTVAPHLSEVSVDGSELTIRYSEALDESSVPAASQFQVHVDDVLRTVSSVSVDGNRVRLSLASDVLPGERVRAGYTVPDTHAIRDLAGFPADAFEDRAVTNYTLPAVSIAALGPEVYEGEDVDFTLVRTGPVTRSLNARVRIWEQGDVLDERRESRRVRFAAGHARASLTLSTLDDLDYEPHTTVSATVEGTGNYDVSSSEGSASVTVLDNDVPEVDVTLVGPANVDENAGQVTVRIRASTVFDEEPHGHLTVRLLSADRTAVSGPDGDFAAVDESIQFRIEHFVRTEVDGDQRYVATTERHVVVRDDTVLERDETFALRLRYRGIGRNVNLPDDPLLITILDDELTNTETVAAAGLTATGLDPDTTNWNASGAIELCWTPQGFSPGDDFEAGSYEYRFRFHDPGSAGLPTGSADGFLEWKAAPSQLPDPFKPDKAPNAMKACDNGRGIGFIDLRISLVPNVHYTYQLRARRQRGGGWVQSDEAGATSVDASTELRTRIWPAPNERWPDTIPQSTGSFVVAIQFSSAPGFLNYSEPVEDFDIAEDLELTNATAALESTTYDTAVGYLVRLTPAMWGEPVMLAVKANAVAAGLKNNTTASRNWATVASAPQRAAPAVTGTASGGDANGDGRWNAGESVEIRFTFDSEVRVDTASGTPTVTLALGGGPASAAYTEGAGTAVLTFAHPVSAGDDDVTTVILEADSIELDGGLITGPDGTDANLVHPGAAFAAQTRRGAPRAANALGASFENVPTQHDGEPFTFVLRFSEAFAVSYRVMRDTAFTVTEADVASAKRLDNPHNENTLMEPNHTWRIIVVPDGTGEVTVTLPATTSCAASGALCTADGRMLSNPVSAKVLGPPGLSVADARVEEAAGTTMDFAVTLGHASASSVTVDYATSDGSATAGDDYTATHGTLAFAPGETQKTVSVAVLDDSHDEGEETLALTLSNPSGGNAWLQDATATGTIENADAMPRAWLARFGRTVAEQVMEAARTRLRSPSRAGVEVMLARQRIGAVSKPGAGGQTSEARVRLESLWLRGATDEDRDRQAGVREVTPRELLTGTSFALAAGTDSGDVAGLWSRGAVSGFSGHAGAVSLEGEVTGAMLGADWSGPGAKSGAGAWTAGLMLSQARGAGSYRGVDTGGVSSTLTGLYPYGRYAVNDRVTVWGVAGYGAGTLTLTPEGKRAIETDIELAMSALGLRGVVVQAPEGGGPALAAAIDAMGVRTSSGAVRGGAGDGIGNLAAAEAVVTRLGLGLEGTWRGLELGNGEIVPSIELGIRHDGGDAETGFGLDLGGGLAWSDPSSEVSAEIRARGLLTHEAGGFRDRGVAGSLGWNPRPDTDRGLSLTLTRTIGASATGGKDALLARDTLAGLAGNDDGDELRRRRLEFRLGYGFSALGDRFTATPEIGLGLSDSAREYRLGWRLELAQRGPASLGFGLKATRHESANDDEPEHGVDLAVSARW